MNVIKNGTLFFRGKFIKSDIGFEGERIVAISQNLEGECVYDATGQLVLPGLVDIHTHGCNGADFCDEREDALIDIAKFQAQNGTTAFLGTGMSLTEEQLTPLFERAGRFVHLPSEECALMWGINMEGPYIATAKKGAHDEKNIIKPDIDAFTRLNDVGFGTVRSVAIAPETEGAKEFIREVSSICRVSLAHTAATYEQAVEGFLSGASIVTHLYNAMNGFSHREPGAIGAAQEYARYVELICDGIHLHPSVVRGAFDSFEGRVCMISDSMRAAGLADGQYTLGGQDVTVQDKKATLADGTIAGSCYLLADMLRSTVAMGVAPEEAVSACTVNPATAVGIEDEVGSLETGKRADIFIVDGEYNAQAVFVGGKSVL